MPRNVTVTFDDGSTHVYQNAPDNVTPDAVTQRAQQEFGKTVTHLDGGNTAPSPLKAQVAEPIGTMDTLLSKVHIPDAANTAIDKLRGVAMGAADPTVGAVQLASNVTGIGKDTVNQAIKQKEAEYQQTRAMHGDGGLDVSRLTGAVISPVNLIPAGYLSKAATLPALAGRSAVVGTAMGAAQPVTDTDNYGKEKALQTVIGAATGGLLPVVGTGIRAGLTALAGTAPGQAAGKIIQGSLQKPIDDVIAALRTTKPPLPGTPASSAEASGDIGLARLQNAVLTKNPAEAVNAIANDYTKNAARTGAIQDIAGSANDLTAAQAARSAAVEPLYKKAFGDTVKFTPELQSIMSRPSVQTALSKARNLAAEEGVDIADNSVGMLHYTKKALDDMIDSAPLTGVGPAQKRALVNTQKALLDQIDNASPAYAAARSKYQELSKPINQMQTLQDVLNRSQTGTVDNVGNAIISGPKLNNILKNEGDDLKKVLTPEQMQTLYNVKSDLDASSLVKRAGAAQVGSNTAANQNAVKVLDKISGGRTNPIPLVGNTIQWMAERRSDKTMQSLIEALRDPQQAADLLEKAQRGDAKSQALLKALRLTSPASAGLAAGAVSNQQ